jgi:pyrroline-5-carboxylate reductase
MTERTRVLLIGAGNMGQALLRGWLERGYAPADITVIDQAPAALAVVRAAGVHADTNWAQSAEQPPPDIVVMAVKPVQLAGALTMARPLVSSVTTILTIVAGKRFAAYRDVLGAEAALIRAMPNTPAAIGRGMTVLCADRKVGATGRALAGELMAAVGAVAWVEAEEALDAVTAVSGSGPAYVFLLIEALSAAAVDAGLDQRLARQLAETTVAGAGAYALESGVEASDLRQRVTSPGGTTEAALAVLMAPEQGLPDLMMRAVRAAAARSRDLA